jgi:hypothetical protein
MEKIINKEEKVKEFFGTNIDKEIKENFRKVVLSNGLRMGFILENLMLDYITKKETIKTNIEDMTEEEILRYIKNKK